MGVIWTLLLTTAIAGVGGTGLGGLVGAILNKDSNKVLSYSFQHILTFSDVNNSLVQFDAVNAWAFVFGR